ncbi:hypothetical protein Ddye_010923 [Dipteronia dyeriana]|uniref:Uncharacterized protein n=1 Tax=Dipteronia dyeriana TaxID=168575 RepID=A0AAD9XE60_9ROSI|nr:hypothetical protein Ddye_010923 [Dipteronia dyeriana]
MHLEGKGLPKLRALGINTGPSITGFSITDTDLKCSIPFKTCERVLYPSPQLFDRYLVEIVRKENIGGFLVRYSYDTWSMEMAKLLLKCLNPKVFGKQLLLAQTEAWISSERWLQKVNRGWINGRDNFEWMEDLMQRFGEDWNYDHWGVLVFLLSSSFYKAYKVFKREIMLATTFCLTLCYNISSVKGEAYH